MLEDGVGSWGQQGRTTHLASKSPLDVEVSSRCFLWDNSAYAVLMCVEDAQVGPRVLVLSTPTASSRTFQEFSLA